MAKKKEDTATMVIDAKEKESKTAKAISAKKKGNKATKLSDAKVKKAAIPALLRYNGGSYSLGIPQNWTIVKEKKHQTFFYGEKVGNARMRFGVTVFWKKENTYLKVAKDRKTKHEGYQEYKVFTEKDISKEGMFKAFLRQSCWYDKKLDQVLFVRDIFIEYQDKIFVTTGTIPNAKKLKYLNKIMAQVMSSFRLMSKPKGDNAVKKEKS